MSIAVVCGKSSMLGTSMDGIGVDVDESANSIDDGEETFPPFNRVDVTSILQPPLIKIEDYNDEPSQVHKRQAHVYEEHVCTICFQKFNSKPLLICHHSREHFGLSRFTCDICARKFGYEDIFMTHCRQHNGSKPFYCPLCNTWFHDLADLNSHAQEFQLRGPIHCFVCGQRSARKFRTLLEKQSDMIFKKFSKKGSTVMYYCEQCQPKDTYDCAVCGRIFMQPGYLRQHYNSSHRSVEPFKCGECFSSFASKCILERHLETHIGRQRPWVCNLCGLRFQQQNAYMSHLQDHKALKPFCCSLCGENFHFEEMLKSHFSKHSIVGTNKSSCFVKKERNCCLYGENKISVNEDICLGNNWEVPSCGRDVQVTAAHVKHETCSFSCSQKETISNGHKVSGNASEEAHNFSENNVTPVLENSNETVSSQFTKQEVFDDDHATVQRHGSADVHVGYPQHKAISYRTGNEANSFWQERRASFALDCVKREVLSDDRAMVQEDMSADQAAGSSETEGSTVAVESAENCAVDCVKKEMDQNMNSTTSCGCPDLQSSGSTSTTMSCSEGNFRQAENSLFTLGHIKTEATSEEEKDCPTFASINVTKERQNCVQQDGNVYFSSESAKKGRSLEGSCEDVASVAEEQDEDEEFCPLDLLSTEITSCSEELPDAENCIFPSNNNMDTRLLVSGAGNPCEASAVVIKTECIDHSFPSEELNIESEVKEESNSGLSSEENFEEGRDEMEFDITASPGVQTSDIENVAERRFSGASDQFSILELDQKIPLEVQLHQFPGLPTASLDNTELVSLQRSLPESNFCDTKIRRHKCCFCDKFMESSISLRQHYRSVHHGEPRHLCRMCQKQFHRRTDLLKHTTHAHKTHLRCMLCDKKFLKFLALEVHYQKHLSKTPYFCPPCQTWFQDLDELECHRACTRPFEELHYCGRCGRKNAWKFELAHDTVGNVYLCEACERCLDRKVDTCEGCGRIFRSTTLLEAHYIREHTGRYQCNDCSSFFDTKCILLAHVETMCGTLKVSTCTTCGRQFQSGEALQQHTRMHHSLLYPQRLLLPC